MVHFMSPGGTSLHLERHQSNTSIRILYMPAVLWWMDILFLHARCFFVNGLSVCGNKARHLLLVASVAAVGTALADILARLTSAVVRVRVSASPERVRNRVEHGDTDALTTTRAQMVSILILIHT